MIDHESNVRGSRRVLSPIVDPYAPCRSEKLANLLDRRFEVHTMLGSDAGIAQLVEHNLAKVGVASSSLVSRSSAFCQGPDHSSGPCRFRRLRLY